MVNYIIRRVLYGLLVLIGVNLLTFILFFAINTPDDMARINIGGKRVSADAIAKWKTERGYDKPLLFNAHAQGVEKLSKTLFVERSLPLFALQFGASDTGRDIGYELRQRALPSLALALPTFLLGVFVVVVASLIMVFFRNTYVELWSVAFAVFLLSVSGLFYIIAGQFLFSTVLKLVPASGFATGLNMVVFLLLPVVIGIVSRMGGEALLTRAVSLDNSYWYYTFRENEDASAMRFSNQYNIPLVNEWFSYTPELLLYYLENPSIQELTTNRFNYKLTSVSSKNKILKRLCPYATPKKKTHGFESLLAFNHLAYKDIGKDQIKRLEHSLDGIPMDKVLQQLRAKL
jgi:ABC-type dipeptide/oligopeptide/nickel transport system permease component